MQNEKGPFAHRPIWDKTPWHEETTSTSASIGGELLWRLELGESGLFFAPFVVIFAATGQGGALMLAAFFWLMGYICSGILGLIHKGGRRLQVLVFWLLGLAPWAIIPFALILFVGPWGILSAAILGLWGVGCVEYAGAAGSTVRQRLSNPEFREVMICHLCVWGLCGFCYTVIILARLLKFLNSD